jgi:exocyst complex component 4
MNANGAALMQLNILVLQQNLLNVEAEAGLPWSALFFDLFCEGPEKIVKRAKEKGKGFGIPGGRFGEEHVKGLLTLCFGERLRDERREVGVAAKRQMDAMLLDISEYMY